MTPRSLRLEAPASATTALAADPALVAAGALFALVMVLPSLLGSVLLVDWTDAVERGVVGLAEAAVVALWATRPGATLAPTSRRFRVAFGLAAVTMLASTVAAPHLAPAIVRTAEWGLHTLFGLVVWTEARPGSAFLAVWRRASLAGVAVVVGAALLLWLRLDTPDDYSWHKEFPFLLGLRWCGTYSLLAVLIGAWGGLRRDRASASGWMLLGWFAIWWSGSRGALGAALVGGVIVVAMSPHHWRTAMAMAGAAVGGAVLSVPVSMVRNGMGVAALWSRSVTVDPSTFDSGRGVLWATTLDAWQASPWLGVGPDGVFPYLAPIGSAHAHNTVIQALGEGGLVSGVPFLVLIAGLTVAALHRAWTTREPARIVAAAYVVAVMANGMLDGVLYDPGTTLLATAALAVALAPQAVLQTATRGATRTPRLLALAGAFALVMGLHLAVLRAVWAPGVPPPDALRWRLVEAFPSAPTLKPVADWGRAWVDSDPTAALHLARWGEQQGRAPWQFTRVEADVRIRAGDRAAGERVFLRGEMARVAARRHVPESRGQ